MSTYLRAVIGALFLFVSIFNLPACGGGGGGNSGPQTGQFIDAPVEGLRYQTPTKSGYTNINGEFQYLSGETVTFYIGNFMLGSAPGAARITPFELAGISVPTTTAEITIAVDAYYNADGNINTSPLNRAANIAVLLQTIDLDGDPSNGITIPAAFVTLINGQTLDFTRTMWDFENDLYDLIAQGYPTTEGGDDGIWGSDYRDVIWAGDALDNMYAYLATTPTRMRITRFVRDYDNNGTIDYLELHAYDAQGNQTMYARDRDGDETRYDMEIEYYDSQGRDIGYARDSNGELPGGITYIERWTYFNDPNVYYRQQQSYEEDNDGDGPEPLERRIYDVNGNRIADEIETNGVVTYRERHQYDSNENRILTLVDSDGDGPGGVTARTVSTYVNNQLMSEVTDAGSDSPDDDTRRVTYNYDANNNLISEETDGDGAGAGGITYRTTYAYDASGRRILLERDADGDGPGVTSYRETTGYDANGRVILRTRDTDGDLSPAISSIENFAYNANGSETLYERDIGGNNGIDYRRTTTYDANNRIIQQITDNDGDGTNVYSVLTTIYEYDANGRRTLQQTSNVNGFTYRNIVTYHPNGLQATYLYEYDSDGIYPTGSYGQRYEYNDMGRQTLYENLSNGVASYRTSYEYDANGNQITYVYDNDGDGPNPASRYAGNILEVVENGTGIVLRRETSIYDANERHIRTDIDVDGDGPGGITEVATYAYDANGNRTLAEYRVNGELTYRETWTYVNGYDLLSNEIDEDGAGPGGITYRETNTYENGRLVQKEIDVNGDMDNGIYRTIYIYDEFGNRIRIEYDGDGEGTYADGVIDSVETYAYTEVPVSWSYLLD